MPDETNNAPAATLAEGPTATPSADPSGAKTIVPQFALDAADAQIATWSTAVVDAADTIERLVASESLPVPDAVRDLATSTTQKLRSLGQSASEQQAADLVAGLQRTAAAHPAAAIGVGAAIGAALAGVLIKLGSPATAGPAPARKSSAPRKSATDAA